MDLLFFSAVITLSGVVVGVFLARFLRLNEVAGCILALAIGIGAVILFGWVDILLSKVWGLPSVLYIVGWGIGHEIVAVIRRRRALGENRTPITVKVVLSKIWFVACGIIGGISILIVLAGVVTFCVGKYLIGAVVTIAGCIIFFLCTGSIKIKKKVNDQGAVDY